MLYAIINFAIFVVFLVLLPLLPIWLFLRQPLEAVQKETESFSHSSTSVLAFLLTAGVLLEIYTYRTEPPTMSEILFSAVSLLVSYVLYRRTTARHPDRFTETGRSLWLKMLAIILMFFLLQVIAYSLEPR